MRASQHEMKMLGDIFHPAGKKQGMCVRKVLPGKLAVTLL
jgi:hypothetical protein